MRRWADGDYVPRIDALALAGRAVAAWSEGLPFEAVDISEDLSADAPRHVVCAGLMAEARGRETRVDRLLPADIMADDPALAWARDFINRPKVWSAMNAVAGALQARQRLERAEVGEIVGRILSG